MIQRCLHFVDTFEALIYYIRWYKLKKGGPTLSVDSPNIDQHKKSALLCSKALSGAPSGTLPRSKNAPLGRFCPPDRRRARAVLVTRWCTRLNPLWKIAIKNALQFLATRTLVHHRGLEPRTHWLRETNVQQSSISRIAQIRCFYRFIVNLRFASAASFAPVIPSCIRYPAVPVCKKCAKMCRAKISSLNRHWVFMQSRKNGRVQARHGSYNLACSD